VDKGKAGEYNNDAKVTKGHFCPFGPAERKNNLDSLVKTMKK
jgi:hypothetical protein